MRVVYSLKLYSVNTSSKAASIPSPEGRGFTRPSISQVNQWQPSDIQTVPALKSAVTTLRADIPQVQQGLESLRSLLALSPVLLGVKQPVNYLVEVLDSTELRPGGGFIGNYGILTIANARVSSLSITDVDLLDRPFEFAGNHIPYPSAYSWFKLAASWSLRDSNLDADFATAASYGEQLYYTEGGTVPVQEVIALTPWLMQNLLNITGPIYVSEYRETITAANLVNRIHYHQLKAQEGADYTPDPNGHSSLRKRFTELLFEHVLARVQQIVPTSMAAFVQLFVNSLHTKDVQLYFNDPAAEALLKNYHLASTIEAPQHDSFMVVDANIIANKANGFMTYTIHDQVTLDASGDATHTLSLNYDWPYTQESAENNYGNKLQYRDYVRIYTPPGSVLLSQDGWTLQGTSSAFGRQVWAGIFFLNYGGSGTITLTWKVPGVAKHDASGWHYQYSMQHQAGLTWYLNLGITLPACATIVGKPVGLSVQGSQGAIANQQLTTDISPEITYTC